MRTDYRELLAVGIFGRGSRLGDRIEMLLRRGRTFSPRASLGRVAASAVVLLALLIAASFAPRWIAFAQQEASPSFEVASVRVVAQSDHAVRSRMRGGPGTSDPTQITFSNVPLGAVILRAYDVQRYQVIGPQWLASRRYDIVAKIPEGTTRAQFNLMLQNLLAERFHLSVHHEIENLGGYELVVGKSGSKLKVSNEQTDSSVPQPESTDLPKRDMNGFPILSRPGLIMMEGVQGRAVISYLTARAQPLSALVDQLGGEFRLPILDKTGLTGLFDFTLEFAPERPGAVRSGTSDTLDESGPNLMTAVQQQLGLRLNPTKVPVNMVVIDRVDQIPTAN